ncbi:MAG: SIMPL domain-containing protein [Rikenellaceae bacterium]
MKRSFRTIVAIVLAIVTITSVEAQNGTQVGKIEVNGQGEIMVEPDEFKFSIIIDEETTKGRVTVGEAERQIIAALKELGIDSDKSLLLKDIASANEKRRNVARTSAAYELKLNDAAQARQLTPALNALAISRVNLVSTSHTQIEKYRSEARVLAVNDAVTKAQELSTALGRGRVQFASIKEYTNYNTYNQPLLMRAENASGVYGASTTEFAPIAVRCSVDAEFLSLSK